MSTVIAAIESVLGMMPMANVQENGTAAGIRDQLLGWIGPAAVLAVAGLSLVFLFRREMTKFVQFLVIAVLVGMLIYQGENLLEWGSGVFKEILGLGGDS